MIPNELFPDKYFFLQTYIDFIYVGCSRLHWLSLVTWCGYNNVRSTWLSHYHDVTQMLLWHCLDVSGDEIPVNLVTQMYITAINMMKKTYIGFCFIKYPVYKYNQTIIYFFSIMFKYNSSLRISFTNL